MHIFILFCWLMVMTIVHAACIKLAWSQQASARRGCVPQVQQKQQLQLSLQSCWPKLQGQRLWAVAAPSGSWTGPAF